MELVSVIMSTYNESVGWVKTALNSIMNQTYDNIDIIVVVDNPLNQNVIEYLRNEALKNSRITLIQNETNKGLVESLNCALQKCKGKFIARMDADDISLPERIEEQMAYMKEKGLDIVGTGFCDFIDEINREKTRLNPKSTMICNNILKYRNCTLHPSWIVKKEVYDKLEGYREIKACEDYDFLVRAALAGYRIGNIPEALMLYRNNPLSISHKNLGIQKATMEFIGSCYRRNKVVNMKEYHDYLTSERIKNDADNVTKYFEKEEEIRKERGLKKMADTFRNMFSSTIYRREKLRNQYIKIMFKIDDVFG